MARFCLVVCGLSIHKGVYSQRCLRLDFYAGSGGDEAEEFFDFGVGEGDAAVGPVVLVLETAEVFVFLFDAVDHDVSAWWPAEGFRVGFVGGVGVGDVKRKVETALLVLAVDEVGAFGGFMVAFFFL